MGSVLALYPIGEHFENTSYTRKYHLPILVVWQVEKVHVTWLLNFVLCLSHSGPPDLQPVPHPPYLLSLLSLLTEIFSSSSQQGTWGGGQFTTTTTSCTLHSLGDGAYKRDMHATIIQKELHNPKLYKKNYNGHCYIEDVMYKSW